MRNRLIGSLLVLGYVCGSLLGCGGSDVVKSADSAAAGASAEYRIGPGDEIQIYVWNHPELSVTVPVRPDGMVSSPLVENIQAAGKTPSQLARDIEKVLSEFVRNPTVNVIVTRAEGALSDQIRVVGQAARPQAIPYRAGMTLLDAMIEVGGLGEFAAGNRARLVRRQGAETIEIKLRLKDLMNDGDMKANMPLQPGDVIIIPETRF
jgi:polysaccharide export outer membrane protein